MDLGALFARSARRQPDAAALVDGPLRRTYAEWYDEIRVVAGGLRAIGLRPGDALATALANRNEMATLYWASQMIGLAFTPFNWRASADELAYALRDAEARAVAFEARTAQAAEEAADGAGIPRARRIALDGAMSGACDFGALADAPAIDGPVGADPRSICLMLYTSGTTGRPKGVPRSHHAERNASAHCVAQLGYRYGECQLGVMPLFHTMGVRALVMAALLNGKLVCQPTFDAGAALRLIQDERITALFLVPTMFHDMLDRADLGDYDLGSVRNVAYAGMSMTSALTEKCAETLKPDRFTNFYGSSEIYSFAVCDHVVDKPGCAGRAALGQEIRIVRADPDAKAGPDETLPQGETGEVAAPMDGLEAFAGYWKRPDADARAIRGGWYFTGDLGYLDAEGELYLVGRVDDMIISGGENIHPEEVEDVLDRSPLVRRAAVVGLPDARMGQKVVAFVEPADPDASAEALDAACLSSGLARFKRPRAYVFVDRIPRSAAGKLLRRFLRDGGYEPLPGHTSTL